MTSRASVPWKATSADRMILCLRAAGAMYLISAPRTCAQLNSRMLSRCASQLHYVLLEAVIQMYLANHTLQFHKLVR